MESHPLSKVYLGLGTNLGDRFSNLVRTMEGLGTEVFITDKSPVYETQAWGVVDQPDFLNMCLAGWTKLSPFELLRFIKWLEATMGRVPTIRWGPRLIDVDILFYDELILEKPTLTIPHKGVAERATVLVPLYDIAPDLEHPISLKTIGELLETMDTSGVKPYFQS